jgi:glucose/arabinose dehydrogenase
LAIANADDGSGLLFVGGQDGRVWVISGGQRAAEPMLDIGDRISSGGERGLLGLAFHPGFPDDRRLFVNYTDRNGNTVVASFDVGATTPVRADPDSEQIILRQAQPYPNHNGGGLAFGRDGYLYIALGDGGSAGDPQDNGQRLDTLLGKILRIDIDGSDGGRAYRIPAGNPFAGRAGARLEIWHYGLRNPFRFSFDRLTGDMWIGDVGQNAREEIDVARGDARGLNFGWARTEGSACYPSAGPCSLSAFTLPITEYRRDQGCSVVGGYVYRGAAIPALAGRYVFADYCTGRLFVVSADAVEPRPPTVVGSVSPGVASFGEDEAGELYLTDLSGGAIYRLARAE